MPKAPKSLKSALHSQQSRLDAKKRAEKASQAAMAKSRNGPAKPSANAKGKQKASQLPKPVIPFHPTDTILLIGEGNFSFARALLLRDELQHLPPQNICATSYDNEEECYSKYPDAREIVSFLKEKGVEVCFSIDATRLEKFAKSNKSNGRRWDKVAWNFPHAGQAITDQDRNILSNQTLLLSFLRSAAFVLARGPIPSIQSKKRKHRIDDEGIEDAAEEDQLENFQPTKTRGTILITLRNVRPYMLWDLPRLAKKPPLPPSTHESRNPTYIQLRSFVFHRSAWNGYEHRMTKGERAQGTGKTGEGGEDRCWEFCLRD